MTRRFDSTRWSIVLGAASLDPVRRDAFGRQYAPIVRAYLAARWRLPEEHERVADAVQDVFVQCFRPGGALERVDPTRPGGFRSFLFGVTANVAAGAERKQARRRDQALGGDDDSLEQLDGRDATPSAAFDHAWAMMIADEAYDLMLERGGADAERRIAALQLRYDDGIPPREIAERAGIDVREVYRLLETGRSHFRAALLEVMAKYHPGESEAALEHRCRKLINVV